MTCMTAAWRTCCFSAWMVCRGLTTQAVFPKAEIQHCVIRMLRNSFKYVRYKDLKKFTSDFKAAYNAPNEKAALSELENMKAAWGGEEVPLRHPQLGRHQFFLPIPGRHPPNYVYYEHHRRAEPPVLENNQDKKRVPKRRIPGKMLYLVSQNVPKKWTQSYRGWNQMLNQLTVLYGERLTQYL